MTVKEIKAKIKELKAQIREKEREKREISRKAEASKDAEEVKKFTERVEELNAEIEELNAKIEELEEELDDILYSDEEPPVDETRTTLVNGDFAKRFRSGGSFGYGLNHAASQKPNSLESMALRSDETMLSRVATTRNGKPLDMGKYIKGMVTGNWENALEERAIAPISTSGVGSLIPKELSAQVIDKARNLSLFASAGVPIVPMISNELTFARVKTDPTFAFKEELAEASESGLELEPVTLKSKMAYGYAYVSLEAIRSAQNLTDVIYKAFGQAFANMIDIAMLYGQNGDTFAPDGILNNADINTIAAQNVLWEDYIKAVGLIKRANGIPTIMGINAATEEIISMYVDANAQKLIEPEAIASLQKIITNQLKEDAENETSDALIFDPLSMVIGVQNEITCRMITDSDYCIKNGAVGFQIYGMLDCQAIQPKHISYISGIKKQPLPPYLDE